MARNLKVVDNGEGGGDGSSETRKAIEAITDRDFNALLKKVKQAQAGMDSERATIGSLVSDACENKHLHKGAFGIFRRLDRMDEYKRSELLFHFDLYRERAKWDESDLFRQESEAAE